MPDEVFPTRDNLVSARRRTPQEASSSPASGTLTALVLRTDQENAAYIRQR